MSICESIRGKYLSLICWIRTWNGAGQRKWGKTFMILLHKGNYLFFLNQTRSFMPDILHANPDKSGRERMGNKSPWHRTSQFLDWKFRSYAICSWQDEAECKAFYSSSLVYPASHFCEARATSFAYLSSPRSKGQFPVFFITNLWSFFRSLLLSWRSSPSAAFPPHFYGARYTRATLPYLANLRNLGLWQNMYVVGLIYSVQKIRRCSKRPALLHHSPCG